MSGKRTNGLCIFYYNLMCLTNPVYSLTDIEREEFINPDLSTHTKFNVASKNLKLNIDLSLELRFIKFMALRIIQVLCVEPCRAISRLCVPVCSGKLTMFCLIICRERDSIHMQ